MATLKRFIANKGLDNNSNSIINVSNPTAAQDAATKAYVDAIIPSQTGNSGKYLTTNGTTISWTTVSTIPSQTGNSGKYLTTDGTTASWATLTATVPSSATAVGSVVAAFYLSGGSISSGSSTTGSNLYYSYNVGCTGTQYASMNLSGTWRASGNLPAYSSSSVSYQPSGGVFLWTRIA